LYGAAACQLFIKRICYVMLPTPNRNPLKISVRNFNYVVDDSSRANFGAS